MSVWRLMRVTRGGVTNVVDVVFKTLSPFTRRAGTKTGWQCGLCLQNLVFRCSSHPRNPVYVSRVDPSTLALGDKPCWQSVVDNTLSLTVKPLTCCPEGILPTGLSGSRSYLILVSNGSDNFDGWLNPGRISRTSVVMTQGDSVCW
jgi:hypothetical protein